MNSNILRYYEKELHYLRELGSEFASAYPKIAGRLGLERYSCADPYVERLIESFAFLSARIQLKIDAEFPQFTEYLIEQLYPNFLAPVPSMMVAKFEPDLQETSLANGFKIPRHTSLYSIIGKGEHTACEYRTAHEVNLFPILVSFAQYLPFSGELNGVKIAQSTSLQQIISANKEGDIQSILKLRLKAGAGLNFNNININNLPIFLTGDGITPYLLLEYLIANPVAVVVTEAKNKSSWHQAIDASHIKHDGFSNDHSLLPNTTRGFSGYRLLQEYFAFSQRYLFVTLSDLKPVLSNANCSEIDVFILFNKYNSKFEQILSQDNFVLFSTPAINLFPKRCDRIHISDTEPEYHIVADRMRPNDFEIFSISSVRGFGLDSKYKQLFKPLYMHQDRYLNINNINPGYYQLRRTSRILGQNEKQKGARSQYYGTEVYISLVDIEQAPFSDNLHQLSIEALCTNRDLPISLPLGIGKSDFTSETAAPLLSIRCISGPSRPQSLLSSKQSPWRLINHLTANNLSLIDDTDNSTKQIKNLLSLYISDNIYSSSRQVNGILQVKKNMIMRRLPIEGPISYARGMQINITLEDEAFEGTGCFLLGSVLERFFAKYVNLNSFTETILTTSQHGEVMTWPPRIGESIIL